MTSRSNFVEAGRITSLRVRALYRYWQSKCHEGLLPSRAAIDPTEIPQLLPYLVIAEIEASPLRVRYRLVGTQVVEDHGSDFTNRYLEDCANAIGNWWRRGSRCLPTTNGTKRNCRAPRAPSVQTRRASFRSAATA